MYQYSNSLIRQFPSAVTGNAAVGVQATVYIGETGTLASLFEVNGSSKSNPVTTDAKGFYSFSLADGDYRIVFSSSQFATLRISVLDGAAIREEFDDLVASNTEFRSQQQAAYDSFVLSQGWDQVGTFAAGFTYTSPNQVGQDVDGNWWRWNGSLPKTVTAGTLPSSDANYKLVGDGVLRSDLSSGTADIGGVEAGKIIKNIDNFTTPEREGGLVAALATGKPVWLRQSTDYAIASLLNIPNDAMIIGSRTSRIVSSVNGTAIQCGAGVKLIGFQIVDDETQPNARGINIAGGFSGQEFIGVEMEFAKECVTFEVDGGSGFSSMGGSYYTRVPIGTGAAIKVNGTDTQAIPRKFINPESRGCTLFDFGGCNDFFAANFYSNGLIYDAASSKVIIPACRIGAAGGNVEVRGSQHLLDGIYAAPIDVYATSSIVRGQAPSNEITDFGSGNDITRGEVGAIPTITAAGGGFSLGNGTAVIVYSRRGSIVSLQFALDVGSTTNMGTGELRVQLPIAASAFSPIQVFGAGIATAGASSALFSCRIVPGDNYLTMRYVDTSAVQQFLSATTPGTFAAGSVIRFTGEYRSS